MLPYRDYFDPSGFIAPLHMAQVLSFYDGGLITQRVLGVVERAFLALVIYFWLARLFRPSNAALAALVTIIYGTGDTTDSVNSYNHLGATFCMLSAFCSSIALGKNRHAKLFFVSATLSGIFAALTACTKQTIGIVATILVPAATVTFFAAKKEIKQALIFVGLFVCGWIACAIPFVFYLLKNNMVTPLIEQSIISGPAAKAHNLGDFLKRDFEYAEKFKPVPLLGALTWLVFWRYFTFSKEDTHTQDDDNLGAVLFAFSFGLVSILVGAFIASHWETMLTTIILTLALEMPLVFYSVLFFIAAILFRFYFFLVPRKFTERDLQIAMYAAVSCGLFASATLSFPVWKFGLIPGLALPLVMGLESAKKFRSIFVYGICGLLITAEVSQKLTIPFGFESMNEPPVAQATVPSIIPDLKGFLLPADTVNFLDETYKIVQEYTTPEDTIFTYPEMALIYAFTDRRWPTLSAVHNIDIITDTFANQEAERIISKRPAVLILYDQQEKNLLKWEKIWGRGNVSGTRTIIRACDQLAKEYVLKGRFSIHSVFKDRQNTDIFVYVRPDKLKK